MTWALSLQTNKGCFHAGHVQIRPSVQTHFEPSRQRKVRCLLHTGQWWCSLARALHMSSYDQTHCWNNWTSSALTHVTAGQRFSRGSDCRENLSGHFSRDIFRGAGHGFFIQTAKAFKCSGLRQTVAWSHSLLIVSTMDSRTQREKKKWSGLLWNSYPIQKSFPNLYMTSTEVLHRRSEDFGLPRHH